MNLSASSRPLVLLLLGGIASSALAQNSVEGRWSVTEANLPAGMKITISFTKGRMKMQLRQSSSKRPPVRVDASGTYTLRGNQLVMKLTDAVMDASGLTPARRKEAESPAGRAAFRKSILQSPLPNGTVRFLGKDRFEVRQKSNNIVSVFNRIR